MGGFAFWGHPQWRLGEGVVKKLSSRVETFCFAKRQSVKDHATGDFASLTVANENGMT